MILVLSYLLTYYGQERLLICKFLNLVQLVFAQ